MVIIDEFNQTSLITYGMFIKGKAKNIKVTCLILKIGTITKVIYSQRKIDVEPFFGLM
ncbi:Mobile element protein [Staphylococcus sp. 8AQ]|nr:Mobile element protein [Staphylococcus pasteuri]VXC60609.1 Mobile element protein [Staphylococcus sp. 8AQ]